MSDAVARLNVALEGRYAIERELGEGGMATVYLADDLRHERKVALKVLKPELAVVVGAERFLAEIKTTANLTHPHILPLHDSGEADGFLFYVMPYVEGESLREKLEREKQLPVDAAVRIATDVAEALDYAHRHGVIHRDIKPGNVLIHDGQPMISDFGIALAVSVGGGNRLTETGLSLGTPHYMSPEQATGDQHVGPTTDIYALGCVLYEMLIGEPPYTGSTPQAILGKILVGEPESVSTQRRSVPANVDAAITTALEKLPADCFPTAEDFAAALTAAGYRVPVEPYREEAPSPRRSPALVRSLAVALAVVATLALWAWLRPTRPMPISRYSVALPGGEALFGDRSRLTVSPDGSRLVYRGEGELDGQLWVRDLDQLHARRLSGTDNATAPFFSPDGSRVGFYAQGEWRVASLGGGPPIPVTNQGVGGFGGSWGSDGYLYLDGLVRVAEDGGSPEMVTMVDRGQGELAHRWPEALPGGRGVVFSLIRGGECEHRGMGHCCCRPSYRHAHRIGARRAGHVCRLRTSLVLDGGRNTDGGTVRRDRTGDHG